MCCSRSTSSRCVSPSTAPVKPVPSWQRLLRLAGNHRIVTFLDDNPAYWGRSINGVAIQPPQVVIELEESD